jgi:DNA-binding transcriptional ArsR family regulator
MEKYQHQGLRSLHRALADPMRIQLLECLWARPQSAKELAEWAGMPPDRLYYHLAQLERAGLIEVAQYRPLPGGKVERVYRPTPVEPPGDQAAPLEVAAMLGAMLEATRADITAASVAKEAGERREITLTRATVRLSEAELITLREQVMELVRQAQDKSDREGQGQDQGQGQGQDQDQGQDIWTRVVVTFIDLQNRVQPATRSPEEIPHRIPAGNPTGE